MRAYIEMACILFIMTSSTTTGVTSELWYVRNGEVEENALKFPLVVPVDHDELVFHWRTTYDIEVCVFNGQPGIMYIVL